MITLTDKQAQTLDFYIRITTQHRKGEREACESLAEEIDEQGQQLFPNMAANAKWWAEKETELQELLEVLNGRNS